MIQITDGSGEEFEVYLTDFVKGTKAQYVTIPFSSFKGKKGGTLDASDIVKFAVWCNSIVPEDHVGKWTVDSAIYFDGIQAVKLTDDMLKKNPVDKNGLIITDKSLVKRMRQIRVRTIQQQKLQQQRIQPQKAQPQRIQPQRIRLPRLQQLRSLAMTTRQLRLPQQRQLMEAQMAMDRTW